MILLHRLHAQQFKQLDDVLLHFPDEGTVLVEGANEAGKSTLFEAVFFALYGRPLLTDRDLKVADLRRYGAEALSVSLDFSIAGKPFSITRRVAKNHTATLVCPAGDDGEVTTITSVTAITKRLREEMRLSADALLNTCFVEQKGLERLEAMDAATRKETVNELLNLRVLTLLEEEFRVTQADRDALERARKRRDVARLDAELPGLQAAEQAAFRCLRYRQLLDCIGEWERLEGEIRLRETEAEKCARRLEAVNQSLDAVARLQSRLTDINANLRLRVDAWRNALKGREDKAREVEELRALEEALPARTEQLRVWEGLLERLVQLENLETEGATLRNQLDARQKALDAHDQLQRDWEEGERRLQALREEVRRREEALREAQELLEARHAAAQRDGRLALLIQHAEAHATASADARAAARDLEEARRAEAALPSQTDRVQRLTEAEHALSERARDRERLATVRENLATAVKEHEAAVARRRRIEELKEQLQQRETGLQEAEGRLAQAADLEKRAQRREALLRWAEAAAHCAEADASAGPLADLERRRSQAEARLEEAEQQLNAARRPGAPAYFAGGLGCAVTLVGLGLQLLPLAVVGVVLLVVGAALGVWARSRISAAAAEHAEAKSARDRLEGEERALRAQRDALQEQSQQWREREARYRSELGELGQGAPATPAEARALADELPATLWAEAHSRRLQAEQACLTAQGQVQDVRTALAREECLARQEDLTQLAARVQELKRERDRLEEALSAAGGLSELLRGLGVAEDLASVKKALAVATASAQECKLKAGQVSELRDRHAGKVGQAEAALAQARAVAEELGLEGNDIETWAATARSHRQAYRQEVEARPDAALQERVDAAQADADDARQNLAVLENEQTRRRTSLDDPPRPALLAQLEAARGAVAANQQRQGDLADVRPALATDGLPTASQRLGPQLAVLNSDLERDRGRAAQLPSAQEELARLEGDAQMRQGELSTAWQEVLGVPLAAEDPEEASAALTQAEHEVRTELGQYDEPALQSEKKELEGQKAEHDREIHTARARQSTLKQQEREIRSQLGVPADATPEVLEQQDPALHRARACDAAFLGQELNDCKNAVLQNRSDRGAAARLLGLGEELLDLDAETRACAEAETRLKVRRRAGEIVARTRRSLVDRVMPLTMQNMRRILPLLTENRYQDAQWDEQNNVISVYDSRAGRFQRKRVFSGGARDQISLALRLSFALATLPGEHNTRPGWLFLDEPLSSFDQSRAQALVEILTRGLVRQQFRQIFLISHQLSFDPAQFDYHVRLEGGHVVESDLPTQER